MVTYTLYSLYSNYAYRSEVVKIVANSPYISILKLKSSLVDISVVAVTCAVLGAWDFMAAVATIAGIMIHSECDIMNDIYDIEIDKICKPDGAISSGQMTLKNAWMYMLLLFLAAPILSLTMGTILFAYQIQVKGHTSIACTNPNPYTLSLPCTPKSIAL